MEETQKDKELRVAPLQPEGWMKAVEQLIEQWPYEPAVKKSAGDVLGSKHTDMAFRYFLSAATKRKNLLQWDEVKIFAFSWAIHKCAVHGLPRRPSGFAGSGKIVIPKLRKEASRLVPVLFDTLDYIPLVFEREEDQAEAEATVTKLIGYLINLKKIRLPSGSPGNPSEHACLIALERQFRGNLGQPLNRAISFLMNATFPDKWAESTVRSTLSKLKKRTQK